MKKILIPLILVILAILIFNHSKKGEFEKVAERYTDKTEFIVSENVSINKENKFAWSVKGIIRNNSKYSIKGYVKIKFLNSSGDILHTTRTRVNDGDNLKPMQAGVFEYYTEPSTFDNVVDFEVIFIER